MEGETLQTPHLPPLHVLQFHTSSVMPRTMRSFILPDLISMVPFQFASSPHFKRASAESSAWIDSFNVFRDRKRADFIQSCTELLVSYGYPSAAYEEFRTCCDFMNIVFLLDEICDDQDEGDSRSTGDVFLRALRGDDNAQTSTLGHITKEFTERFNRKASKRCQQRLWSLSKGYLDAMADEAECRRNGRVPNTDLYMQIRREVSGVRLCYGMFEYVLGIELPDQVFENPTFLNMYWAAVDMIGLSNDLYSYKMEYKRGLEGSNYISVLMREKGLSLQGAVDHIGAQYKALLDKFLRHEAMLPSFGHPSVDSGLRRYVECMKQSIVGYNVWCFDTYRYFGPEDRDVRRTLVVRLDERVEHARNEAIKDRRNDTAVTV
ncbi:terpenoid synthase [Schizopora paradoxa]|uniref:Terpene synthase n=1 Tax=Schizopora paradoxa TaxID=27342 RepID=A0A0H2R9X3_9AGAM|nr:terpenoid synthase [Schizopora paradoxa]